MIRPNQLFALSAAFAVNAVAFAAIQLAMTQTGEQQRLALQEPARIVVVGERPKPAMAEQHAATQNCTPAKSI